MFTGNRGCLVDERGEIVRHHSGNLWITCTLSYKDWRSPLTAPRHWTPLFFLDEAVALAAGHRPCGLCRPDAYRSYRDAVAESHGLNEPLRATDLNRWLARERLRRGRGLDRSADRLIWQSDISGLAAGTVLLSESDDRPLLLTATKLLEFTFDGWVHIGMERPDWGTVSVLTPPTSVAALVAGFEPALHPSTSGPV